MNSLKTKRRSTNRDSLGSRFGTMASRVNLAMAPFWMTQEEIAARSGLKLNKARARLYAGTRRGLYEKEKLFRYRLKPIAKRKKANVHTDKRVPV